MARVEGRKGRACRRPFGYLWCISQRSDDQTDVDLGALTDLDLEAHPDIAAGFDALIGAAGHGAPDPHLANAALVAKQAATVDVLSAGRLTLGVGLGGRDDDDQVSGGSTQGRGERFEEMLEEMQGHWRGEKVGPKPVQDGGPPLWVGGMVDAAYRRAARFGAGWIMGGGSPDQLADGAEKTRQAFRDAGREEEPRIGALIYFALGEDAAAVAHRDLTHYYAWLGGEMAEMIASSAATDEETVKTYVQAFAAAGCDEAIFLPHLARSRAGRPACPSGSLAHWSGPVSRVRRISS